MSRIFGHRVGNFGINDLVNFTGVNGLILDGNRVTVDLAVGDEVVLGQLKSILCILFMSLSLLDGVLSTL